MKANLQLIIADDRQALLATLKRNQDNSTRNRRDMKRLYLSDTEYQALLKVAQERGYYEPDVTDAQTALEAMLVDISLLAPILSGD